jgi:IclR family transcriptional regulator, KDG regulon repressor
MGAKKDSPAVERALNILEAISQGRSGLTNSYLARRLGIPKSSASSILHVLQMRGYVCRYEDSGRYKLGCNVLALGRRVVETSEIREVGIPYMRLLVDRCDLTCHLAILGQYEAIHLEKIVANRYLKTDESRAVGERIPLHSTSVGKALLAWQSRAILEAALPHLRLNKLTSKTITTINGLMAKLDDVRRDGYALDDEECRPGWRCVGAPIFDQLGNAMVAICVTGRVGELDDSKLMATTAAVKETADRISRRLAFERVHFATC